MQLQLWIDFGGFENLIRAPLSVSKCFQANSEPRSKRIKICTLFSSMKSVWKNPQCLLMNEHFQAPLQIGEYFTSHRLRIIIICVANPFGNRQRTVLNSQTINSWLTSYQLSIRRWLHLHAHERPEHAHFNPLFESRRLTSIFRITGHVRQRKSKHSRVVWWSNRISPWAHNSGSFEIRSLHSQLVI